MKEKPNNINNLGGYKALLAKLRPNVVPPLPEVAHYESLPEPEPDDEPETPHAPLTARVDNTPTVVLTGAVTDGSRSLVEAYISQFASPASRRTIWHGLLRCARLLGHEPEDVPWAALRFEHTAALRAKLLEPGRFSTATIAGSLGALRGIIKHSWRMGLLSHEDFWRATDWQRLPRRQTLLAGRELKQEELDALRAHWAQHDGAYGAFLAVTFNLMIGAGLRATEMCRMPVAAYDNGTIRLLRKGGKLVALPLFPAVRQAIETWLPYRGDFKRIKSDALILRVQSNDWVRDKTPELDRKTLEYLCLTIATRAGIGRFTPHDCRRTFATRGRRMGLHPRVIQFLMSHESLETTGRYDRTEEEEYAAIVSEKDPWASVAA